MSSGFIFSNAKPTRIARHLVFWFVLAILFYIQSLVPAPEPYYSALMSLLCFFPTCVVASYILVYFFLPAYLEQKKYAWFGVSLAALLLICLVVNCYASTLFLHLTCHCDTDKLPLFAAGGLGFVNTTHVLTIGGLAMGIKIGKNWHLKRNENLALSKQKIDNDLRLQKSRIHPGFLFNSLNTLHARILASSNDSPGILLKLSDLLSYTLYEGSESLVPLERELAMIENLVDLERTNHDHALDITLNISGNPDGKYISPLTLFSLLQHGLEVAAQHAEGTYGIKAVVAPDKKNELHLQIKAMHLTDSTALHSRWERVVADARKRLSAVPENSFRLQLTADGSTQEINLHLALGKADKEATINNWNPEPSIADT